MPEGALEHLIVLEVFGEGKTDIGSHGDWCRQALHRDLASGGRIGDTPGARVDSYARATQQSGVASTALS